MAKVTEASTTATEMKAVLNQGTKTLSGDQVITFKKYNRTILPVDGYVFWVLDNTTPPLQVQGSLHYDTDQQQRADETIGINKVVFTTQTSVAAFNDISNGVAYIGAIDNIRFAFTSMKRRYAQAGTFHYQGDAIYPVMNPQISDTAPDLLNRVATNSMPIWLSLNQVVQLYPAFLLPSNFAPPYGGVEITHTHPLQAAAFFDSTKTHSQLISENVKIITHGLRNDAVLDFLDSLIQYSLDTDAFGIQNMPVVQDVIRGQSELGIIAQKKMIELEINYYQTRTQAIARQMINAANIEFAPDPFGILDQNFQLNYSFAG